jgi:hypothetical protein
VRSDLLFTILERMRVERIELVPYAAVPPPVAAGETGPVTA